MALPPYDPPPVSVPRRGSRAAFIILAIAAVVVVLLVFGGVALVRSVATASQEAAVPAGRFLDALRAHDYRTAYALLTPQAQAATSSSALQDIQELLEKRHGPATGHDAPTDWSVNSVNGATSVRMNYRMRFRDGGVPVVITLTRTSEGWRVVSYNFQL